MKLAVIKSHLKDGLSIVERVSSESSTLPILKNVLIEAQEGGIHLTATNLEMAATSRVAGKVLEKGKITIPIRILADLINNLQSERLNLEVRENILEVKTDNYHATIQGMSADDFPIIPKINNKTEQIEVRGDVLTEGLNQIISSAQTSELRPELSSVLFDFTMDNIKLVTTDSFRLSEKTIPSNQFTTNFGENFRIIIPLKTAQEIVRIVGDKDEVIIQKDPNQILFTSDTFSLISRLVEGNYPDYTAILPKTFETEIRINRQELMNSIKLAGVFSSKVNEVKIKIGEDKKTIEIFSLDQTGENNCTLSAKVNGKPKEIGYNWKYLLDGLRALKTEEVFWGINEENKPSLIRSPQEGSYFYVVMPILKT